MRLTGQRTMLCRRIQTRTRLIKQQQTHSLLLRTTPHKRPRHRQPLHLPSTQTDLIRRLTTTIPTSHVPPNVTKVDGPAEEGPSAFGKTGVYITDGAFEVGVEPLREAVDDFFGAAESGGEADAFGVLGVVWVTEGNVLSDL